MSILPFRTWNAAAVFAASLALPLLVFAEEYSIGVEVLPPAPQTVADDPMRVRHPVSFTLLQPGPGGDLADKSLQPSPEPKPPATTVTLHLISQDGLEYYDDESYSKRAISLTFSKDDPLKLVYVQRDASHYPGEIAMIHLEPLTPPDVRLSVRMIDVGNSFKGDQKISLALEPNASKLIANGVATIQVRATLIDVNNHIVGTDKDLEIVINSKPPSGPHSNNVYAIINPPTLYFPRGASQTTFSVQSVDPGVIELETIGAERPPGKPPVLIVAERNMTFLLLWDPLLAVCLGAVVNGVRQRIQKRRVDSIFFQRLILEGALAGLLFYMAISFPDKIIHLPADAFNLNALAFGARDGILGGLMGTSVLNMAKRTVT